MTTKNIPERLIILFDQAVYPPVGGTVMRASSFTDVYRPLVELAGSNVREVIIAGSYYDTISVSSLFPKPETVVVSLLTTIGNDSLDKLGRDLRDIAEEATLLYLLRFPPRLDQSISLARLYNARNFHDLMQKMRYDPELIHFLFGVQPQVVSLIMASDHLRAY